VLGLIWIVLTAWLAPMPAQATLPVPHPGFLAPDFSLQNANNETIRISDMRGKVVVVNFWASWCTPCQAEMPALQYAHQHFSPDQVAVLAVNATTQDTFQSAKNFLDSRGLSLPVLFDLNGSATTLYQVRGFPTTVFIDRNGIIRDLIIGGPLSQPLLISKIEGLLGD
jgi:peroxiredoxin